MVGTDENKQRIKSFLSKHIRKVDLQDDEDIFAAGFVTSMFAMQLVMFIESEWRIRLANREIKLDNFRTVNAMAALIAHKTAV